MEIPRPVDNERRKFAPHFLVEFFYYTTRGREPERRPSVTCLHHWQSQQFSRPGIIEVKMHTLKRIHEQNRLVPSKQMLLLRPSSHSRRGPLIASMRAFLRRETKLE